MLNELKRYLNIENNEKDFLLENWILEAKEFIKSEIWEFEKSEKQITCVSKNGKIFLSWINIEIKNIEKNIWDFLNPRFEEKRNFRFINNILYLDFFWELIITYNSWFNLLPDDLKQAIFLYIKEKNDFENGKIKKEVVDMDSVEFELDNSTKNKIFSLISKYKIYDFSA